MVKTLAERVSLHVNHLGEESGSHPPQLVEQLRSLGYVE
jgi:hypothetical protein